VSALRMRRILLWSILAIPIVAFYTILAIHVLNVPFLDDYETVLPFMTQFSQLGTLHRIGLIFTFQHNEYKLIFENAIFALQYLFLHHPNFIFLCIVGDLLVLALFAAIWSFLLPTHEFDRKLLLALPIAYALFELRYAPTLNWSMAALQNISVPVAVLWTIWCLVQKRYLRACILFGLAICCSGNGFLLFPIGFWLLRRHRKALLGWLVTCLGMIALYSYHYVRYIIHGAAQGQAANVLSPLSLLEHLNPLFALSFMGSVIGVHWVVSAAVGAALVTGIVLMVHTRFDRVNPTAFYFAVFLVITAICVSSIRSSLGLSESFTGRYRVYSILLFVCMYVFGVERNFRWYRPALAASILLCAFGDAYGHHFYVSQARWAHDQALAYTYDICGNDDECHLRHFALVAAQPLYRLPPEYTVADARVKSLLDKEDVKRNAAVRDRGGSSRH
jgi:hypothetical protein